MYDADRAPLDRMILTIARAHAADAVRHGRVADQACWHVVRRARQVATALGDCPEAWTLLEAAAGLERELLNSGEAPS